MFSDPNQKFSSLDLLHKHTVSVDSIRVDDYTWLVLNISSCFSNCSTSVGVLKAYSVNEVLIIMQ